MRIIALCCRGWTARSLYGSNTVTVYLLIYFPHPSEDSSKCATRSLKTRTSAWDSLTVFFSPQHFTKRRRRKPVWLWLKLLIFPPRFRYWCRWYCPIWAGHKKRLLWDVRRRLRKAAWFAIRRSSQFHLLICILISLHFNIFSSLSWQREKKMSKKRRQNIIFNLIFILGVNLRNSAPNKWRGQVWNVFFFFFFKAWKLTMQWADCLIEHNKKRLN